MLLSIMTYVCLWTVVLGGILDVGQPRAKEADVEPVEGMVAQDSPPCPLHFMFQYGSLYYYATYHCDPNNNCEPGAASASIKFYNRRVQLGCKPVGTECGCNNQVAPAGDLSMLADASERNDANGFFAKGDSTTIETQFTDQFVVKAPALNATDERVDVWFRTVRVELFNFQNQQRLLNERIAIMVSGKPDPTIIGPFVEVAGRYDQGAQTLTIVVDGSPVKFRVAR